MYCRSGGRCFMDGLQRRIRVARGEIPAELVLRNARLVNVCSGECYPADIAIADGRVVGISAPGEGYRGHEERDLQGRSQVSFLVSPVALPPSAYRSEEHTSELQSHLNIV